MVTFLGKHSFGTKNRKLASGQGLSLGTTGEIEKNLKTSIRIVGREI